MQPEIHKLIFSTNAIFTTCWYFAPLPSVSLSNLLKKAVLNGALTFVVQYIFLLHHICREQQPEGTIKNCTL